MAMSSTYFRHKKLALPIFYGCNEDQSYNIQRYLSKADSLVHHHPMLAPGIMVELDRFRLVEQLESVKDSFVSITEIFGSAPRDLGSVLIQSFTNQENDTEQLPYLYNKNRELAKGIRIVKRQIRDMIRHTYELENIFKFVRRKRKFMTFQLGDPYYYLVG